MRGMRFVKYLFKETFTFILLAVLVVLPVRLFIAQPFLVDGESMYPTFENGDYLIIDQISYRLSEPERGDVIVFRYPNQPSTFYIKRIIGLPGETVRVEKGIVTITAADGTARSFTEPYIINDDTTYTRDTVLGEGEYYVMGDNRPKSSDSRIWGVLPEENIIGRAFVRLLPISNAGFFPGKENLVL